MAIGILLLVVSAGVLLAGAELFAENAVAAGRRLGVTGLAVGVLLAGAEPEELLTAVTAAARGRPGIAIGDAIGANITMLTLVLGLAALIRPVPVTGRVRTYAVGAVLTGAAATVVLVDGRLSRLEGVVLVAAYAALVAVVWRREQHAPAIGELAETLEDEDEDEDDDHDHDDDGDDHDPGGIERPAVGLVLALGGIAVPGGNAR